MAVELHLPDLPEVPISIGAARPARAPMPWHLRLRDIVISYLPLLMMAVLALATWWLVKYTPSQPPEKVSTLEQGVPDYAMSRFSVQRYTADGRLRVQLQGEELRHYPNQDRIEVDAMRLHTTGPDGRVTQATASRGVSNGALSELQLLGGARVLGTDIQGDPIEIRSEFLQAFLNSQVVRTDRAVVVTQGANRVSAGGLEYDAKRRQLKFVGPVRAVLQAPR